jgi:hypothetical protein
MCWARLGLQQSGGAQHIAIDSKPMRASKDTNGRAEHVLSAFCEHLQTVLGHEASRGKGREISDALLLEWLDVKGKIVTGERAMMVPLLRWSSQLGSVTSGKIVILPAVRVRGKGLN